ncbi:YgcG family protein [Aquabacterium sp. A08]|uniref:TPM domain-containing protein n=1 Tax=Aquabacterium sp. A08 TaxID=2718532 RepID=UPI001423E5CE|nr:TPM domain-containing protein [Aquabacterium sp. A08]NIC40019.1 YgcG family protein [Aquabacterium sp. A08]
MNAPSALGAPRSRRGAGQEPASARSASAQAWHTLRWGWCILGLWLWAALALAQTGLQPVPPLTARVMDQTATLTAAEREALEAKLAAFEAERGSQVVVVLVATTAPEDIADYTQRLGDAWKIGRRDVGDGVLLVVARDDRRLRIATARAVEGAIPDLVAHRIIEQAITPAFRAGRYADGLQAGVDQILARLRGEDLPLPGAATATDRDDWVELLVFVGFAAPIIAAVLREMLGRRLGSVAAGGAIGAIAWQVSGWWWLGLAVGVLGLLMSWLMAHLPVAQGATGRGRRGGPGGWGGGRGPGGWGGGGGFRSGGGGGFGGGGASGRW